MKLLSFIGIAIISLLYACNDADYSIIDNQVYISNAEQNVGGSETIIMNNGADISVLVRLAKKVDYDVEVELGLAAELLEEYNQRNQTEYLMVPDFQFPTNAVVKIPAGEISSSFKIVVNDFETKGNQYALPIKITKILNGGIDLANTQSRFIYALAKPLRVSVPVMSGFTISGDLNENVSALPKENWGINVNEWSLECWTKLSAYNVNNQAIFNLGSNQHEIYIRFGDANSPYNYLQIKTLGGQIQTASNLVANRWYHWAFVYDGTTLTIYRDGEVDVKFQPPSPIGGNVRMDYVQMISSGSRYFPNRAHLAQVKLWKKAISQTQIKNNMYFEINPKNTDLVGYWPMNEGSGNTFKDITGNGHDAAAGSNIIKSWDHNIDFKN
ncbi:DUF1735 and LamG domain-containing protein [Sphingobacterium bovistauri]|uniref:DUF1735 domain-containing protein n=1 Tax=Sphingobacterium bovistauri TaxID=2781959 RepID=A0ABS7Z874_9SPHI|nr:DUF1735 and LamG domain-containing protein [Sphingobacterium bovistauri]MCA5005065.1 DUF1735 domain-containing protein [Sphingobacterium bovistauri]